MALALDGHASQATTTSSISLSLTTTLTNDIIYVYGFFSGSSDTTAPTIGISDTAGLSWQKRLAPVYTGYDSTATAYWWFFSFWALSTGTLSADAITFTGGDTASAIYAIAINGADLTAPFDTNTSLPAYSADGDTATSVTISTNDQPDFVIYLNATATLPTGFTEISSTSSGSFGLLATESSYEITSSLLSSANFTGTLPFMDAIKSLSPSAGGNTLVSGGNSTTADGSTPAAPTLSNSLISTWYANGMSNYLNAASGGSVSSTINSGGLGLYVQANEIIAGTINSNGGSNATLGGGGGGVVILSYGSGGYTAGTYSTAGGAGTSPSGTGGNGAVYTYNYSTAPINVLNGTIALTSTLSTIDTLTITPSATGNIRIELDLTFNDTSNLTILKTVNGTQTTLYSVSSLSAGALPFIIKDNGNAIGTTITYTVQASSSGTSPTVNITGALVYETI